MQPRQAFDIFWPRTPQVAIWYVKWPTNVCFGLSDIDEQMYRKPPFINGNFYRLWDYNLYLLKGKRTDINLLDYLVCLLLCVSSKSLKKLSKMWSNKHHKKFDSNSNKFHCGEAADYMNHKCIPVTYFILKVQFVSYLQ